MADTTPNWVRNGAILEYDEELRTRDSREDEASVERIHWKLMVLQIDTHFVLEVDRFGGAGEHEQHEYRLSEDYRPETDNDTIQRMIGNFPFECGDGVRIDGLPGRYEVSEDSIEIEGLERECWYLRRTKSRFTPKDTSTELWFDQQLGILLNFVEVTPRGYNSVELTHLEFG